MSILSSTFVVYSCKDTPDQIVRYQKKISGPLMDRIDVHIEVPAVDIVDLQNHSQTQEESSAIVKQRVTEVRAFQLERQGCFNSELSSNELNQLAKLGSVEQAFMEKAVTGLGLSARGYHRVLRLSRTIADMQADNQIRIEHLAEALSYRTTSKVFM